MKFSRLILANLFRKKVRLILTIGSFAIALVLFTFLAVVKSAFSRGTEIAGADRLVVVSRIGLMQLMPISHRDKILAIPGVKAVTHNHWFGGVYQDEKNFFPQFVIDPENQRQVMTELVVPDDQWNNFLKDRMGAIAGARTAARSDLNFFPQFVIDPENQRQVMTELVVPDDQWNNFLKDRMGAIAGARTAAR